MLHAGMGWHGAPACMPPHIAPWPAAGAAAPMIPTPLPQLPTPQDISDVIAQVLAKRKVRAVVVGFEGGWSGSAPLSEAPLALGMVLAECSGSELRKGLHLAVQRVQQKRFE